MAPPRSLLSGLPLLLALHVWFYYGSAAQTSGYAFLTSYSTGLDGIDPLNNLRWLLAVCQCLDNIDMGVVPHYSNTVLWTEAVDNLSDDLFGIGERRTTHAAGAIENDSEGDWWNLLFHTSDDGVSGDADEDGD